MAIPQMHLPPPNDAYAYALMVAAGWTAKRLEDTITPDGKFGLTGDELKTLVLKVANAERATVLKESLKVCEWLNNLYKF